MSTDVLVPEEMSPEGMRVVEAYLDCGSDITQVGDYLGMPQETVMSIYNRPEVKHYITTLFMESGFRNRDKFFGVMDEIVKKKLEDLEESELGSDADILEIMKVYHKMKMDEMAMQIKLLEAQTKVRTPTTQTNIQNNFNLPGSDDGNYMALMNRLSGARK
ncbi:hypothetical protein DS691_20770 [Salmonella enterica subsp. enterica serovar Bareilly]|nr:hypothetical protein [Salmonella enterica subsp. enterica serovar Bareilly]